ncbi:GNAT family N-acetyltransferase [Magnetovibrio sp.]|uniref:GNAT family N-acetyltransferase n=1 Tax=Magnetovibrio sp. TaxID=2024836 RepID=UPI002F927555
MPDGSEQFDVSVAERLSGVSPDEWDACAGAENPFLSYAFLASLEDAGCVDAKAGWSPRHVLIKDHSGALLAASPLYLKGNSMGEYVFDWGWAEAYERAGGTYYPKLMSGVPFTPVTGPRLLVRGDLGTTVRATLKRQLAETMAGAAQGADLSSLHANFIPDADVAVFNDAGYLSRVGLQYHWHNRDYGSYDDFLGALSSRKRKALKKERRIATADSGVRVERLSGDAIRPHHWDALYGFYLDTSNRKWGQPYLNRDFFQLLGERMADRVMLVMAMRDGDIIAGALNLIGTDALYGRYWGCIEDVRYLHFEVCYHQAIDAAIELGLARVEAGAQGEHKIARGYVPVLTHSAHFIPDPGFRRAVAQFLDQERRAIHHERELLHEESPYRQGEGL